MENKLNKLFDLKENVLSDAAAENVKISEAIQMELNKVYDDWPALHEALSALESHENVEYCTDENGDATAYITFYDLTDVPEREREFFENYLKENYCVDVEWDCNRLVNSLGSDEIFINDSGREWDRGVYQNGKRIITEKAYIDDENDVDEVKRNALIENHMERSGCFPGVFRTSEWCNTLYPVNTLITETEAFNLGYREGLEQGDDFSSGITWNSTELNEAFDRGVNAGIAEYNKRENEEAE